MKVAETLNRLREWLKYENYGWLVALMATSSYFCYLIEYLMFESWEIQKSTIYYPLILAFSIGIGIFIVGMYARVFNKII